MTEHVPVDQSNETECNASSKDGQHCNCWYDGKACCYCNDPAQPQEDETMNREIHDHKVNEANEQIVVAATDGPGPGGASHVYQVSLLNGQSLAVLHFQNGAIKEAGVNGITHEVLLAIVADRLRAFQAGPYACRENALALTKIEEAQHWLHHRTRARAARGVEGTLTV